MGLISYSLGFGGCFAGDRFKTIKDSVQKTTYQLYFSTLEIRRTVESVCLIGINLSCYQSNKSNP